MSLEEAQDQTYFAEVHYLTAKNELARLLKEEPLESKKRHYAEKIMAQIGHLKKAGKLPNANATELLENTTGLLNGSITPDFYKEKAQKVQGSPSLAMQILGGLMMALGALVAAAFVAVAAVVGFKPSADGIAAATVLVAGIGLFSAGFRAGLSKSMDNLAEEVKHNPQHN